MRYLLVVVLGSLLSLAIPGVAGAAVIDANVGPGFTISMGPVPGPGTHTVRVNDQSTGHNFSLVSPSGSVVAATTVAQTGVFLFSVTFVEGTYTFVCDPHAGSMFGSVVVPPPPPPPLPPAPTNDVAPSITGDARPGGRLTCSPGTWSSSPTSFAYQWRRNGVTIAGAAGSTLDVTPSDAGATIVCRVSASNAGGVNTSDSSPVAVPPPIFPVSAPSNCTLQPVYLRLANSIAVGFEGSRDVDVVSHEISVARDGSADFTVVPGTSTGATIPVSVGAAYSVRVRAQTASGTYSAYCTSFVSIPERMTRWIADPGGAVEGWSGPDTMYGGSGNDLLRGIEGNDAIYGLVGDDTLLGGEGDDGIAGNSGNDTLTGGPGSDVVAGGPGDDRLSVRDGKPNDLARCGSGRDLVYADVGDRVARTCERVVRVALPAASAAARTQAGDAPAQGRTSERRSSHGAERLVGDVLHGDTTHGAEYRSTQGAERLDAGSTRAGTSHAAP